MTLSQETMLELMQYADGELDGETRARIEGLLRSNAEARGVVEAMGTLGDVVRDGVEERARGASAADGIADGVMSAIAAAGEIERRGSGARAGAGAAADVVPFVPATDRRKAPRKARPGALPAAVAILALAAGVALFARSKEPASRHGDIFASAPPASMSEPQAEAAVAAGEGRGVDLEEVRSIRNKVNVFFTPPPQSKGPGASASVVVWIDDSLGGANGTNGTGSVNVDGEH